MSLLASALVAHMPVALLGFNLEDILISTGPWVLVVSAIIVFIESGVLFPVLPGDSLIFALGMLHDRMGLSLWLAFPVLIVAAVAGGEVVVGEVGVVAEAAHEVVFGGVQVGWREDGDVRRQQAARAFAGFECLPEGFAAAFAFGMDGGEAVVPEVALLLVEGAVVVGDLGGQLLQAVVFEEGVQRWT